MKFETASEIMTNVRIQICT